LSCYSMPILVTPKRWKEELGTVDKFYIIDNNGMKFFHRKLAPAFYCVDAQYYYWVNNGSDTRCDGPAYISWSDNEINNAFRYKETMMSEEDYWNR
ncbi:MAG: hypothetical protein AABY22_07110, partial [Nanoarchaeota archaeon]